MACFKVLFAFTLVLCLTLDSSAAFKKRSADSDDDNQQKKKKDQQKPSWQPNNGPHEFHVDVDDNIKGANQHRHEALKDGKVTGTYAAPGGRDGKWLKYDYVADDKGFRITSTKEVNVDELMQGQAAGDHQAKVSIKSDSAPVQYTVNEDQLNNAKQNKEQPKDKQ